MDKILLIMLIVLGITMIIIIAMAGYLLFESGKDNVLRKICEEKGGVPIDKENGGVICVKNDSIIEMVN